MRSSSLQTPRVASLLLSGVFAFGVGVVGHALWPTLGAHETPRASVAPAAIIAAVEPAPATAPSALAPIVSPLAAVVAPVVNEVAQSVPAKAVVAAAQEVRAVVEPKPEIITREVELGKGRSVADMLANADVDPQDALAVAAAMNKVYPNPKVKAGQEVALTFTRLGEDEKLTSVVLQPEPTKEVTITRAADGLFTGQVAVTPIERQRFAVRTEIRGSLYETGQREGVPHSVMAAILRAYAHAIDFQRDIHAGDKLEVLYDQPMAKNGKPAGQGVIIYAAIEIGGKTMPLYRVTFADGGVDYFDERGQSVKRSLLRTPLDGGRVTSRFGMRMHPMLGYSKMHQGIDFGAATGTPIFAAGAGVVEDVGPKGAYGRYVRIRHNNGIKTAYAHMSRFSRGMYQGAKVSQGDVIGFVGSSGRSTGPHLHYEVMVNSRQVNPLSVNLPTGRVLEGKMMAQFKAGQTKIQREFASLLAREASKTAEADQPKAGVSKISAAAPAFENKSATSCGSKSGC